MRRIDYCLFMNCFITKNNENYSPKTKEKKWIIILWKQLSVYRCSQVLQFKELLQIKEFIWGFLPNQKINRNLIFSRSIQHFQYLYGYIIYGFCFLVSVNIFFHLSLTTETIVLEDRQLRFHFFINFIMRSKENILMHSLKISVSEGNVGQTWDQLFHVDILFSTAFC